MCHQLHISMVLFYWFDSLGSIGKLDVCDLMWQMARQEEMIISVHSDFVIPASNLTSTFDHLYIKQFKSIVVWNIQKKQVKSVFLPGLLPSTVIFVIYDELCFEFYEQCTLRGLKCVGFLFASQKRHGKKVKEPLCHLYTNSIGKIINEIFGLIRH